MKTSLWRLSLLLGICLWQLPASAVPTTYYVSNGTVGSLGLDSRSCATASNISTPKLTISAGVACLSAGDTLYIRGGTYTSTVNTINSTLTTVPSGSSTGWQGYNSADSSTFTWSGAITISGYPADIAGGQPVVIRPPDSFTAINIINGASYLHIRNLVIDMVDQTTGPDTGGQDGVYVAGGSNHLRFQGLEIKNNMNNGFQISKHLGHSPFIEMVGNLIHDNGRYTADPSDPYNNGYGIYAFTTDVLIDGNEIYDNGGYGIHMADDFVDGGIAIDISRAIVRNNNVHDNGGSAYSTICPVALCTGGVPMGGTVYNSNSGILVGMGSGIQVYNNVVYGNNAGIAVYELSTAMVVYNNTVYNNRDDGIWAQSYTTPPTIRNNIAYSNGNGNIHDYGGSGGSATADHNLLTNPSFTNASAGDFTITCTGGSPSPACQAGQPIATVTYDIIGTPRPQGSAYDEGAYEGIISGGSTPTITTTSLSGGTVGTLFNQDITITGGSGTYTSCDVPFGAIPTGVTVSIIANKCHLGSTPTVASAYNPTIRVCDSLGACDLQYYEGITIECSPVVSGVWTLKGCPGASSSNGSANAVTTGFNTTGADIAICGVGADNSATFPTIQDSNLHMWTQVGATKDTLLGRFKLYYTHLTTVGANHTFSAVTGGLTSYPVISCVVLAGSKTAPFDTAAAGAAVTSSTSIQAGSLTLAHANQIVVTGFVVDSNVSGIMSVNDGFLLFQRGTYAGSFGGGLILNFFPATGSANPIISWTGATEVATMGGSFFSADSTAGPRRIRSRTRAY